EESALAACSPSVHFGSQHHPQEERNSETAVDGRRFSGENNYGPPWENSRQRPRYSAQRRRVQCHIETEGASQIALRREPSAGRLCHVLVAWDRNGRHNAPRKGFQVCLEINGAGRRDRLASVS